MSSTMISDLPFHGKKNGDSIMNWVTGIHRRLSLTPEVQQGMSSRMPKLDFWYA